MKPYERIGPFLLFERTVADDESVSPQLVAVESIESIRRDKDNEEHTCLFSKVRRKELRC